MTGALLTVTGAASGTGIAAVIAAKRRKLQRFAFCGWKQVTGSYATLKAMLKFRTPGGNGKTNA
jgi:hypothetical protein